MKSRNKISLPSKAVLKRSETNLDKIHSEHSPKARKLSSISLQQNLDLFQQYSYFAKPIRPSGDADTYFKQTLRNYDQFDLNFFRKLTSFARAKSSKSSETLRKKASSTGIKSKPTSARKHLYRKTPTSTRSNTSQDKSTVFKSVKHIKLPPAVKSETEEFDGDIFYSPNSYTLTSSINSLNTIKNQSESSIINAPEETEQKEIDEPTNEESPKSMAEEEPEDFPQTVTPDEAEFEQIVPPVGEPEGPPASPTEAADEAVAPPAEGPDTPVASPEEDAEDVEAQPSEPEAETEPPTETETEAEETGGVTETDEAETEGEGEIKGAGDGGSCFKFDPAIDATVLKELEEAEQQAKATAKVIYELKTRVCELLKKDKHTEAEARELEEKNRELKAQMLLFEDKTKRIQFLIAQTNLFEKMIPPDTPLQTRHNEDILPKVIICGMTEHNIPKLILCDEKKKKSCSSPRPTCPPIPGVREFKEVQEVNIPMSVVPKFAKRLSDSYTMQERLAAENADLEGMRYKLQSDLLNKDQTIEYLQRKLYTIQCEMRMLCKENTELNEKIQQVCEQKQQQQQQQLQQIAKQKRMPCGKNKGTCPADIEGRLTEYSETTKLLEKQLCDMENDVKSMQTELTAVQAEREHLEQHKKVIICPPMYPPCGTPCAPCTPCIVPCADQQLRELREQYCRLQDDFKGKVCEVACLRADNEKLKTTAKEAEDAKKLLDDRVKDLERQLKSCKLEANKFMGLKEKLIEQEQQLAVAKQRFREAQDELEELRSFIQDQQQQLDDYRNKYLEAQQEVEEQRRRIDMLEMEANRVNEQVNLEIQRVKCQFQEKLQELLPLPELLKTTQLKLQEAQQMHLLAERNNDSLNRELQIYKDKIAEITDQMDRAKSDNALGQNEKELMTARLQELEAKVNDLEEERFNTQQQLQKTEELLQETDRDLQARMHEIAQLSAQLESVREESARQVARNKERCETVRRSMQNQVSDLERQLAQSRAQARSAQKDRDEIRAKMQSQINNLHENFEDAQMRIRSLQGHVNFLKESYNTNVPGFGDVDSVSDHQEPCLCGREF